MDKVKLGPDDRLPSALLCCAMVLAGMHCAADPSRDVEAHEQRPKWVRTMLIADEASVASRSGHNSTRSARYHIDAGQSEASALVFVGGLLAAFGHDHMVSVRGIRGEVEITPTTIEPAAVQIIFDAKSAAEVGKEFAEKDRQKINHSIQDEALQTSKFPEIAFKSTKVSITKMGENHCSARIAGELTLHGTTRAMEVPADVTFRERGLTAQGTFKIRHSDFAIRQLSAAAGAVKAKDGININYKLAATAE